MKKSLPIVGLSAAALSVLTGELYRHVFCREGSPLLSPLMNGKSHKPDYYAHRDGDAEKLRRLPCQRFELRSGRGALLRGYYYPGGGEGKRIAFRVHGYRSEHAETAGMYYETYRSRGFDLFCCDHEAHGESEGRFIGFAAFEDGDCLRWIDFLRRHFGDDVQIDARPALTKARIPILFVHGREDPMVPFRNAPALYESYGGAKDCLFVDGARHVECMHVAPEAYAEKLDGLIRKYFI